MTRLLLIIPLFGAFVPVGNAPSRRPVASLCSAQERIIFSCRPLETKVVSLCASSVLTSTSGYMQYRFGRLGQPPEFSYPQNQEHPKDHFRSGTLMYSGGGGAYLEFTNGDYKYVIFDGIGKGWESEGVEVSKAGKQVSLLPCRDRSYGEMGPDLFEKAAIPASNDDDFEIPY